MKKLGGGTEHHDDGAEKTPIAPARRFLRRLRPAFQDVPAFALVLVLTGTRFTSPLDWAFIALAEGF